jgi:hypothetical protein
MKYMFITTIKPTMKYMLIITTSIIIKVKLLMYYKTNWPMGDLIAWKEYCNSIIYNIKI